jgi:molybdopterin-guanine dinucleotide biosynthesis protein A
VTAPIVRGAILAGGAASRFGGKPKGLEKVGGERILDRLVRAVHEVTGEPPFLVANAPAARTWLPTIEIVPDVTHAADRPVLVVAWDMPFVPPELLRALVAGADAYDVFLPESSGKRGVEPLCGVYGPASGPPIKDRIDQEDFRAIGFHDTVKVGTLPLGEVSRYGDPALLFYNVNTAKELAEAEAMWRQRG